MWVEIQVIAPYLLSAFAIITNTANQNIVSHAVVSATIFFQLIMLVNNKITKPINAEIVAGIWKTKSPTVQRNKRRIKSRARIHSALLIGPMLFNSSRAISAILGVSFNSGG